MQKDEKSSAQPRARYVWDRDKLAWVETAEEAIPEEPTQHEVVVEAALEEGLEGAAEEAGLVEAAEEAGGLEYRGAFSRLVALVADLVVLGIIVFILGYVFGTETTVRDTDQTIKILPNWASLLVLSVYLLGFWAWRGQTPGKMLMGAKIVKTDGSPMGFGTIFLRYIAFVASLAAVAYPYAYAANILNDTARTAIAIIIGLLLFIVIAFNRRKRGLHDMVAGTVVVNSRLGVTMGYLAEQEPDEAEEEPEASD